MKRVGVRRRSRNTGPPDEVVDLILERAGYSCELCNIGLRDRRGEDWQAHHRRARRMGGDRRADTNQAVNLLVLCPTCHETVERERTAAYRGGWLVRQEAKPADIPVLIGAARWVLLTVDGRYEDLPERVS